MWQLILFCTVNSFFTLEELMDCSQFI